jgi:hypothetical protein
MKLCWEYCTSIALEMKTRPVAGAKGEKGCETALELPLEDSARVCPSPFSVVRKTAFSSTTPIFRRLTLLLSEAGGHSLARAVNFYRSRDTGQSTTIGQLGGLQHSAADAPKPTTSPASSSRRFDCLPLCFKAILPHLLDLQQQLGR